MVHGFGDDLGHGARGRDLQCALETWFSSEGRPDSPLKCVACHSSDAKRMRKGAEGKECGPHPPALGLSC